MWRNFVFKPGDFYVSTYELMANQTKDLHRSYSEEARKGMAQRILASPSYL